MGTMATIYRQLDIPNFDAATPRFQAYLDSQRDYQKNALALTPDEREEVGRRWADVFKRLDYPV